MGLVVNTDQFAMRGVKLTGVEGLWIAVGIPPCRIRHRHLGSDVDAQALDQILQALDEITRVNALQVRPDLGVSSVTDLDVVAIEKALTCTDDLRPILSRPADQARYPLVVCFPVISESNPPGNDPGDLYSARGVR